MKKIIILFLVILVRQNISAQTVFTNDDAIVHLDINAQLYVEGDVLIENTGVIENQGTISLENDWINNSLFNVFLNSLQGNVELVGNNQNITGINPTKFYNLKSTNVARKTLGVETWVENELDITNSEIVLNSNTIHLFNTDPAALLWNGGFVSGDSLGGYLLRSVDRSQSYWFPVGNSNLANFYRAVSFVPSSSDSSVIGVRLAERDHEFDFSGVSATGSVGPFPFAQRISNITENNSNFYHNIARFDGTANGVSRIFYFNSDESAAKKFNAVSEWDNGVSKWSVANFEKNVAALNASIGNPENVMKSQSLDFSNDVYVLSTKNEIDVVVPDIFSPNKDGVNDVLFAFSDKALSFQMYIYNRWGELVFETKDQYEGWDGTFRGKDAQSGVYVYFISVELPEQGSITKKGDITLVR